ncbi:hypothetical protein [Williamsia sp.]|uniref:hypothetical protein n=1 Tax=Williamsia sp. TaxID=1872085 RepID=UPI002F926B7A
MGEGPGTGASLQFELNAQREAAESGLEFFAHVGPLASRLGMTDYPEFSVFRARFCQTDDLSTAHLRADGAVLQQLHASLATQVDVQEQQDAALVVSWPDGSGIVAQQNLRSILPRAESDLSAIADLGAGMLVAADCIDVARFTQFHCIAGIDPDNLLGVPIALWLKMKGACLAHHAELRGAITATVELFGTAVSTCDEAIEAILSGLCRAMGEVDTTDYPAAVSGPVAHLDGAADVPPDRECGGDGSAGGGTGAGTVVQAGAGAQSGAGAGAGAASQSDARTWAGEPTSDSPVSGSAGATPAPVGVSAHGAGGVAGSLSGEAASELLGPLLGVVGTITTAAVSGLAEAITTLVAQGGVSPDGMPDAQAGAGPALPATEGSGDAGASIMLGDKVVEIKSGSDGASVSLTVTGAGGDTETHVIDVRPDGSIETQGMSAADPEPEPEQPIAETADGPVGAESDVEPLPGTPVGPSTEDEASCPPVESGSAEPVPEASPQTPSQPPPELTHTTPGASERSPNKSTSVTPQSSGQDDAGSPQEDGRLALAGDQ